MADPYSGQSNENDGTSSDSGFGAGSYGADVSAGDTAPYSGTYADTNTTSSDYSGYQTGLGFGQGSYGADIAEYNVGDLGNPDYYGIHTDPHSIPGGTYLGGYEGLAGTEYYTTLLGTNTGDVLARVRQKESGGNYNLTPQQNVNFNKKGEKHSEAAGAYQFEPGTWRQLTQEAGIGTQYATANLAPPYVQDQVALYAATHYDPNSTFLWHASAPPGGFPAVSNTLPTFDVTAVSPGGTVAPTPSATPKKFFGVPIPSFLQPKSPDAAPSAPASVPSLLPNIPPIVKAFLVGGGTPPSTTSGSGTSNLDPTPGLIQAGYTVPMAPGLRIPLPGGGYIPLAPNLNTTPQEAQKLQSDGLGAVDTKGDLLTKLDDLLTQLTPYLTIESIVGSILVAFLLFVSVSSLARA